jgi:hypothetical protein
VDTKLARLGQAFKFLIRSETFAVNRAALAIEAVVDSKSWDEVNHTLLW